MEKVYRIMDWHQRKDVALESCNFSVKLDARFAEKTRNFHFKKQREFERDIRKIVGCKYARSTFLNDTLFLRSMAVEDRCTCLGVSGNLLGSDWDNLDTIEFNGHNIDSKALAFDLLTIFTHWVDVAEALIKDQEKGGAK